MNEPTDLAKIRDLDGQLARVVRTYPEMIVESSAENREAWEETLQSIDEKNHDA